MAIRRLQLAELDEVEYVKPNFVYEYNEVLCQREVSNYFKDKPTWLTAAAKGKEVELKINRYNTLNNFDDQWERLEEAKKRRVERMFESLSVEMPILLRDGDFWHLLAGNTRLAYAKKNSLPIHVWVIETPDLEEYF